MKNLAAASLAPFLALALAVPATAGRQDPPDLRVARVELAPPATVPERSRAPWRASGSTLGAQARSFLVAFSAELGLRDPEAGDLVVRAVRQGRAVDVVRFRQMAGGFPVHEGEIAVTLNRRGEVVHVASAYRPIRGELAEAPAVSEAATRAAAREALGLRRAPLWERTELVVFPSAERAVLSWRYRAIPAGEPAGEWQVILDATTGEVLRVEDVAFYVDGTGQAFLPNPLATAGVLYGTPGYVDGNDADTPQLLAEIFPVTLLDITFDGANHSLVGPWAECIDWDTPNGVDDCPVQASSDFSTNSRSDQRFEGPAVYFHIDNYLRYLNVTLGLTVHAYQYPGGTQYDPHGFNGADNSSYSSGTGRLRFGEGGVDDSEDPDVMIHELGHGIHDWITSGGLSQQQGLSEGLGDYFAVSYMRSFGTWAPSDPQYNWVFGWDGHNPFWPGRVTNWNDTHQYPQDLIGQIHTDGQFWSSCNMDVWEAIGREATDTAMVEGISMTSGSTNQMGAAAAVLQAAIELGYSSADLHAIDDIYKGCGYDTLLPLLVDGFESGDTTAWSATFP